MAQGNGNITPIFSRVADIQGGINLTTGVNDYTGNNNLNKVVFQADPSNGGFVQRLRMKALGTNIATCARIYISDNTYSKSISIIPAPGTPTGAASSSGGVLATQNLFCIVTAQDQYGNWSAASSEIAANVAITGPTGSVTWNFNASAGAVAYRCYTGPVSGGEECWFANTGANSCLQTTSYVNNQIGEISSVAAVPNILYGELSLPATTLTGTSATTEIDYPMNIALPPGYRILVGLANTVAAGWIITGIGGKY